jgi:hypothetical protein
MNLENALIAIAAIAMAWVIAVATATLFYSAPTRSLQITNIR